MLDIAVLVLHRLAARHTTTVARDLHAARGRRRGARMRVSRFGAQRTPSSTNSAQRWRLSGSIADSAFVQAGIRRIEQVAREIDRIIVADRKTTGGAFRSTTRHVWVEHRNASYTTRPCESLVCATLIVSAPVNWQVDAAACAFIRRDGAYAIRVHRVCCWWGLTPRHLGPHTPRLPHARAPAQSVRSRP
jgi:hypothetical protein